MTSSKRFGFLMLAGLFTAASLFGCGSSSEEERIPTSVTVFNQHSIVFGNDSSVRTAGYNAFGQLGDGSRKDRAFAGPVQNLGRITGFAAGGAHTLAFTNNSTVMAWGFNQSGQLGSKSVRTGAATSTNDFSPVPVLVDSLNRVTSVAAGLSHSLAVSNGRVFSWGGNTFGQLGNTPGDAATPNEVFQTGSTPFTNPTQVAAGAVHSLVLADGRVWAWGDNELKELGPGAAAGLTSSVTPVEVVFVGKTVKQIAAAGSFSVALMTDGTVWAWGHNQYGQLGSTLLVGERLGSVAEPVQVKFQNNTDLVADEIAAGSGHVLARVGDTVWAWGLNQKGQLGNNPVTGTTITSSIPVQMLFGGSEGIPGSGTAITDVVKVQAFGESSLVTLRNASSGKLEVWGWGDNSFGQLGAATNSGFRTSPIQMQGL